MFPSRVGIIRVAAFAHECGPFHWEVPAHGGMAARDRLHHSRRHTSWPCRRASYRTCSTDYVSHETAEKAARRGVWRAEFVVPSRWRRGERLEDAAASGAGDCRIKGNISRKGARIYHVSGGASYAKTRIDAAKGVRWFCTETEARAAGWRRAVR